MKYSPLSICLGLSLGLHAVAFTIYTGWKDCRVNPISMPVKSLIIELLTEPEHPAAIKAPPITARKSTLSEEVVASANLQPDFFEADALDMLAQMEESAVILKEDAKKEVPCKMASVDGVPSVIGAMCLTAPKPIYPREARRKKQQGVAVLNLAVNENGNPTDVRVVHSSGFPLLDESAKNAVLQWRFVPAQIDQVAVKSRVEVPIRFQLSN